MISEFVPDVTSVVLKWLETVSERILISAT